MRHLPFKSFKLYTELLWMNYNNSFPRIPKIDWMSFPEEEITPFVSSHSSKWANWGRVIGVSYHYYYDASNKTRWELSLNFIEQVLYNDFGACHVLEPILKNRSTIKSERRVNEKWMRNH